MKRRPAQAGKIKTAQFAADLDALCALPNVSESFAKTSTHPPLVEGEDLPDYWSRVDKGTHVIFFAHPLAYGQSLTTQNHRIPARIHTGKTTVETTLVFPPYQSLMLEIDADGKLRMLDIALQPKTPEKSLCHR